MAAMSQKSESSCKIFGNSGQFLARDMLREAVDKLRTWDLSGDRIGDLEIAIGEALNNVIEHAYEFQSGHPVRLEIRQDPEGIACIISDEGNPIPDGNLPHGAPVQDGCAFEELPEGGFGWFIIRSLADSIEYDRQIGKNTLKIHFPSV